MSNVVQLDCKTCPRCALSMTVVRDRKATTLRYDVGLWESRCLSKDCDGLVACPWMGAALQLWLQQQAEPAP